MTDLDNINEVFVHYKVTVDGKVDDKAVCLRVIYITGHIWQHGKEILGDWSIHMGCN